MRVPYLLLLCLFVGTFALASTEPALTPLSPNDERMGEGPVLGAFLNQDAEALVKAEGKAPAFEADADDLRRGEFVRAYAAASAETRSSSATAVARGHARLALILARLGATDDAIDHVNEAGSGGEARLARAWILWSRGLTAEAVVEARAAVQSDLPAPEWLAQEWTRLTTERGPLAEQVRSAVEKEAEVASDSEERLRNLEKQFRAGFSDTAFMELSSALSLLHQASAAEPEKFQLRLRHALRLRRDAVLQLLGRSCAGRLLPEATSLWQIAGIALRSACDVVPAKDDWELVFKHWLQCSSSLSAYDFSGEDISGDLTAAEKGSGVSSSWRLQLKRLADLPEQRLASAAVGGLRRLEGTASLDFLQFERVEDPLAEEEVKALATVSPDFEKQLAEVDAVRARFSLSGPASASERSFRFSVARLQFRLALANRDFDQASKALAILGSQGEKGWRDSQLEKYAAAVDRARFDPLLRLVDALNSAPESELRQRDLSSFHLQASSQEFLLSQRYGPRLREPLYLPDEVRTVLKGIHNLRFLSHCAVGNVLAAEDELQFLQACTREGDRSGDVALKQCTDRIASLPWKSQLNDHDVESLLPLLSSDTRKPETVEVQALLERVPAGLDTKSLDGLIRLAAAKKLQNRDNEAAALLDHLRKRVTQCKAASTFLSQLDNAYSPEARLARARDTFESLKAGARKEEARRLIREGNEVFSRLQQRYGVDFSERASRLSTAERALASQAAAGLALASVEIDHPFLACLAFGHLRNLGTKADEIAAVKTVVEALPFQMDATSAATREAWLALKQPLPREIEKRQALLNKMGEGFGESITARLGQVVFMVATNRWEDADKLISIFRQDFGVNLAAAKQISVVERHLQSVRGDVSEIRTALGALQKEKTRYQNDLRNTSAVLDEERQKRAALARQFAAEAEALNQSYSRGEISQYDLVAENRALKERANQTLFNEYQGRDRARREAFVEEAGRKLQELESQTTSLTRRHEGLLASMLPNLLNELEALGALPKSES